MILLKSRFYLRHKGILGVYGLGTELLIATLVKLGLSLIQGILVEKHLLSREFLAVVSVGHIVHYHLTLAIETIDTQGVIEQGTVAQKSLILEGDIL